MVEGKRVAVVVPAYDEALLVAETIRGIPDFVDLVVVVDDCSADDTAEQARATGDQRLEVLRHEENRGVGAAIATGYARCRDLGVDVTCVMAADNQMDPEELAQTTMDPSRRMLVQVEVDDAAAADQVFSMLMGDQVEPRRLFIEQNAKDVRFLDV